MYRISLLFDIFFVMVLYKLLLTSVRLLEVVQQGIVLYVEPLCLSHYQSLYTEFVPLIYTFNVSLSLFMNIPLFHFLHSTVILICVHELSFSPCLHLILYICTNVTFVHLYISLSHLFTHHFPLVLAW